jgi:hypothetical protein
VGNDFIWSEIYMNNRAVLSDAERSLLLECLKKHKPELIEKAIILDSEIPNPDVANKMRGAVTDELAVEGFDSNWNLNEYGAKLEGLIDRLGSLYLWPNRKKKR